MDVLLINVSRKLRDAQAFGTRLLRIAIAVVLIWIGGLKYFDYESEGIVPYVANSPFMSFFYAQPKAYKEHQLKEGEYTKENYIWHQVNNTHGFGFVLGMVIVTIGILLLLNKYSPVIGMIGAVMVILMSFVTLSFLITTPEAWVPALGDPSHGFPLLAARGRLVVKDIIMAAGGFVVLCDSCGIYLSNKDFRRQVGTIL